MPGPPRIFTAPPPEARELDLVGFLRWLEAPAIFHLPGRRRDVCRVLVGGLHGNEPSGFHAIHALLRDPPPLPVDAVLVVGNVAAALHEIPFVHRFLPGGEDMNRVWGHREGSPLRDAAGGIQDYLDGLSIESLVDLHNNSGHNPIYGVVLRIDSACLALGRRWTERFVLYRGGPLGTLLEGNAGPPGVVIECGQAGAPEADRRAEAGARDYLSVEDPIQPQHANGAQLFRSVARIHVPLDVQLAFDEGRSVADVTISPTIDQYNFQVLEAGSRLAYCNERGRLLAIGSDGRDATDEYLETRDGAIFLRRSIVPVMMTTDAVAAKSDCLLYAARPVEGDGSEA